MQLLRRHEGGNYSIGQNIEHLDMLAQVMADAPTRNRCPPHKSEILGIRFTAVLSSQSEKLRQLSLYRCIRLTFCSTAGARCSILQCPGIVSNVVCVDGPLADSPGVLVPAMLMSSAQVRLLILRHSLNEIHEAESRFYRDTAAVRLCGRG